MTFLEYLTNLQNFLKQHPETASYLAIYCKDDEGNGYRKVVYTPELGLFDDPDFIGGDMEPNAVCVN